MEWKTNLQVRKSRIVYDRETGKAKGYGFCEFHDEETASSAIRNLNGYELSGRHLRVDYAEDSKGTSTAKKAPVAAAPVGLQQAAASQQALETKLGAGNPMGSQPDQLTHMLSGMSHQQLYDVLNQMKTLIQHNPQQARQILIQNPQLTKALFQAQLLLGMIQNPNEATVPGMQIPAPAPPQAPPQPQPMNTPVPPVQGMQQPGMGGMPPMRQGMGMSGPMGGMPGMMRPPMPPGPQQPMHGMPGGQHQGNMQFDPNQQNQLLQQLANLTPEQIQQLPPQQQQQVLELQAQLRRAR